MVSVRIRRGRYRDREPASDAEIATHDVDSQSEVLWSRGATGTTLARTIFERPVSTSYRWLSMITTRPFAVVSKPSSGPLRRMIEAGGLRRFRPVSLIWTPRQHILAAFGKSNFLRNDRTGKIGSQGDFHGHYIYQSAIATLPIDCGCNPDVLLQYAHG
jgi:hypothetical protein